MAYPVLAPNRTWFSQGGTTTQGSTFTKITIVDSYTPTGDETESWNADVNNTGAIKWYKKGTELIISGNGSGKIAMNPDSKSLFYLGQTDAFKDLPIPTDFHDTAGFIWFNNLFGLPQRMTSSSTHTESNATTTAFAVARNDTTKRLTLTGGTSNVYFPHDITAQSFTAPAPSASSKWRANVTYKYLVTKPWWGNN